MGRIVNVSFGAALYISEQPSAGIDNFTLGGWCWVPSGHVGAKIYHGSSGSTGYGIYFNNTGPSEVSILLGGIGLFGGGNVPASTWCSIIYTRNGGTSQVYLDGAALGSTFLDAPNALAGSGGLLCNSANTGAKFAEMFLYSRVLTASEIAAIGGARFSPAFFPQNLLQYWPIVGQNTPEPPRVTGGSNGDILDNFAPTDHPAIVYPGGPFRKSVRPSAFAPGLGR